MENSDQDQEIITLEELDAIKHYFYYSGMSLVVNNIKDINSILQLNNNSSDEKLDYIMREINIISTVCDTFIDGIDDAIED